MKEVAYLIRGHLEDIVFWTRKRQPNGFLEALSGLFQAAKRKARVLHFQNQLNGHLPASRQDRLFADKPLCGAANL